MVDLRHTNSGIGGCSGSGGSGGDYLPSYRTNSTSSGL